MKHIGNWWKGALWSGSLVMLSFLTCEPAIRYHGLGSANSQICNNQYFLFGIYTLNSPIRPIYVVLIALLVGAWLGQFINWVDSKNYFRGSGNGPNLYNLAYIFITAPIIVFAIYYLSTIIWTLELTGIIILFFALIIWYLMRHGNASNASSA